MMPGPTSYPASFPALYLYPLNDSFIPKHISLVNSQRVKIGRQTNAKTVPAEKNGYFDSKVLSRQHAEVWEEANKIFIKDVKSSNGTFINGDRLSAEGVESDPYELKSDDIVEFGIDIVGDDNKTIIHHKVAARVVCVFSEQDVQIAQRAEAHQAQAGTSSVGQPSLSPANGPPVFGFQSARRLPMQPQLGGMGGSMRPPGSSKSGLTFEHICSRLQGELQKSRDTGAELNSLTGTLGEIGDTIGGNIPQHLPPFPSSLPPVRLPPATTLEPSSSEPPIPIDASPPPPPDPSALTDLQAQLQSTQSSLASQNDKIRALEDVFMEHEAMKREVGVLRDVVEGLRHDEVQGSGEDAEDDGDDASSIMTVVNDRRLEDVAEEDEDQLAAAAESSASEESHPEDVQDEESDEDRRRRRDELGRPHTPEPIHIGLDYRRSPTKSKFHSTRALEELTQKLSTLSTQLESALEKSELLQAQHNAAQDTIKHLEEKVESLDGLIRRTSPDPVASADSSIFTKEPEHQPEPESLTQLLASFQKSVEGQWLSVRTEWNDERDRLNRAREEFEAKMKVLENGIDEIHSFRSVPLSKLGVAIGLGHGDIKGGLVTPPSPRSLSGDSHSSRKRRRGRISRSLSRGRDRSTSPATSETLASETEDRPLLDDGERDIKPGLYPITPESSVRLGGSAASSESATGSQDGMIADKSALAGDGVRFAVLGYCSLCCLLIGYAQSLPKVSTAVGIIVIGVAAVAVLWRVKPE